tara:strand:- start:1336 stop:2580 length:1245 start_codon:yes stop_codon:yes gene_type:complete
MPVNTSAVPRPLCYGEPGQLTQPPKCKQPRLKNEKTLVHRSIGGCARCVAHPNGSAHGFRCFPAIIVIGVMKGGTTELGEQARHNHPHLHMARNEEHFFGHLVNSNNATSSALSPRRWHDYLWGQRTGDAWGSWDIRNGNGLAIEKSPSYFRSPSALMQINTLLPTARLVLLLREPASRAYSHFRMITGCRHLDASNDATSFHEMAVREVKTRCARAAFTSLTMGSAESPACLPRLHACGKLNFASDNACTRITHKVYQDVPSKYTSSLASSSSMIERSIYGNSIRRMYAAGWGCDRVAIIVSERFKAEPTEVLRSLWKALGVPYAAEVSSEHHGKAPGMRPSRRKASQDMRNDTLKMLEKFFRPSVYDVAGLVPALKLQRWWPSYFVRKPATALLVKPEKKLAVPKAEKLRPV